MGSLFAGALILATAGCSSTESPLGAGGAAGSASGGTGAGGSGTSTAGTGTGNTGSGDPSQVVGTFVVQMKVDKSMTSVVGKVSDLPVPSEREWRDQKTEGDCRLRTPRVPFCEVGCDGGACVADGKCQPFPTGGSVGAVTLKGVKLEGGGTEVALKEVSASYQPPAGTTLSYPPFGAADTIEVHAAGADYAGFDLSSPGVNPIDLKTTDFAISPDAPFALEWDAAPAGATSKVYIKIDVSHHGGVKGLIECETADDGSLTISKELMAELIDLGVAGFPTVLLVRSTSDTAQLEHGKVRLEVSALVERYLTIPGLESCAAPEDCPEGKTCAGDSTCQ